MGLGSALSMKVVRIEMMVLVGIFWMIVKRIQFKIEQMVYLIGLILVYKLRVFKCLVNKWASLINRWRVNSKDCR